jgi:hypothetical protein
MMKRTAIISTGLVTFALVTGLGRAHAAIFTLVLQDVTNSQTVTVTDNGAGDLNAVVGAISYVGPLGSSPVSLNMTSGVSQPVLGTPYVAEMDLHSLNIEINSATQVVLNVLLSDVGFSIVPSGTNTAILRTSIGGNISNGTVEGWAYFDPSNTLFGMPGATSVHVGPFVPPPTGFVGESSLEVSYSGGDFSLTNVVQVVFAAGSGTASIDQFTTLETPEPASFLIWGLGLGIAGALSSRRRKLTA